MSQDGQAPTAFTPPYGAPEQWAPKHYGQTGPWTDVWGLALCLVEVLVGRPVIEGDPNAMMGTTLDPQRRPRRAPRVWPCRTRSRPLFRRALALDPRARQRDAGCFGTSCSPRWRCPIPSVHRLQRDPRADDDGGVRVERVEVRSRSSGSLPRVPQPSAAVERALAMTRIRSDERSFALGRRVRNPAVHSRSSPRSRGSADRTGFGARAAVGEARSEHCAAVRAAKGCARAPAGSASLRGATWQSSISMKRTPRGVPWIWICPPASRLRAASVSSQGMRAFKSAPRLTSAAPDLPTPPSLRDPPLRSAA